MGALAIAEKSATRALAHEQQQYLTFQLAGDAFALGILAIREIMEFGKLTAVPQMPSFVRGVINLRGAVVPVIDLGARFGKGPTAATHRTCIVIVEVATEDGSQVMGIMVDAVNEVMDISGSDIEPAPSFGSRIRADFIRGMGKIDGGFVIIIDIDRVLSVGEIAELGGPMGE